MTAFASALRRRCRGGPAGFCAACAHSEKTGSSWLGTAVRRIEHERQLYAVRAVFTALIRAATCHRYWSVSSAARRSGECARAGSSSERGLKVIRIGFCHGIFRVARCKAISSPPRSPATGDGESRFCARGCLPPPTFACCCGFSGAVLMWR